ncbi:4-hydroxyphenylacetate 3-hydroxylase family protein [Sabulicella rubraurantiaca]|uniref:4-hydroxyphenylacetate 3-hydroxylase family protein n=1 Tax=Sabulicella rubraurantiaca TaxID=2811429 RepID=UPI001A97202C|nr:4-hydroxyphenylacetate 3-hydroxylase N-terminal domain-containing protein [Sabulicella rubraurantiaca]
MNVKTGAEHRASLRDGRDIRIEGRRVADVTEDPAFRGAVASGCALYDAQSAPEAVERLTYEVPGLGGRRANRAWQAPRSYAELVTRREALEEWAEGHVGFIGRSPDHVASCLVGMEMDPAPFEAHDLKRAGALRDYVAFARAKDLFLTYVIINPQADRSKQASQQSNPDLALHIVDEDHEGITVRGGKMLATSSVMANEIFVSTIQPMAPGDERHAVCFAIPVATRGLRLLSRKSYEAAAGHPFDAPLASRFDENDAVAYFDEVKVPWERVFATRDLRIMQAMWHETPAHVLQNYQCQIRLLVKMRFLAGIARRTAEINGTIGMPPVRDTLGQLAAEVGMVEGLLRGMEAKGRMHNGFFVPDRTLLYSAQVLTQQLYPRFVDTLRELAGGGLIMLPSSAADYGDAQIAHDIAATQCSSVAGPMERVKFFKLAWDAVGSEFASRHVQYEKFYAGAQFVTRGHSFRTFDWTRSSAAVDRILGETPEPVPATMPIAAE